jgi:hypothetical protein
MMSRRLALELDPGALELIEHLAARHDSLLLEHALDQTHGSLLCPSVHAQGLGEPAARPLELAFGEQGPLPGEILGGDQVQGAAHRPRAHDRALIRAGSIDVAGAEARRASPDAQPGGVGVLSLDPRHAAHHLDRVAHARGSMQQLRHGAHRRQPGRLQRPGARPGHVAVSGPS